MMGAGFGFIHFCGWDYYLDRNDFPWSLFTDHCSIVNPNNMQCQSGVIICVDGNTQSLFDAPISNPYQMHSSILSIGADLWKG